MPSEDQKITPIRKADEAAEANGEFARLLAESERSLAEGEWFSYPGHEGPVAAITGPLWSFGVAVAMGVAGAAGRRPTPPATIASTRYGRRDRPTAAPAGS